MKYALCYVSTIAPSVPQENIKDLLEQSCRNNDRDKITGILLYSNGNFFQVLEGDKDKVEEVFEKIRRDKRHYDLITIFKKPVNSTQFESYESEFFGLDTSYSEQDIDFYTSQVDRLNPEIRKSVNYILNNFS